MLGVARRGATSGEGRKEGTARYLLAAVLGVRKGCNFRGHAELRWAGSVYREILFLKLAALGRDHIDIADFEKKYKSAYSKLASNVGKESLKQRRAQPLTSKAVDCWKSFGANLEC